jgi:hypothetical protein
MPIVLPIPAGAAGPPPAQPRLDGPAGSRPLGSLRPGVRLADGALVRWVGRRRLRARTTAEAPIRLRRGALGPGVPSAEVTVSPEQPIQPDADGPLVPARALLGRPGIAPVVGGDMLFVHAIFDRPTTIRVNACPVRGATLDDLATSAPSRAERTELLRLFPELVTLRVSAPAAAPA